MLKERRGRDVGRGFLVFEFAWKDDDDRARGVGTRLWPSYSGVDSK